jgi:hypothetical protein
LGDIDAGGLRIAAHLEDAFGTRIRLHQMNADLAFAFGSPLQSQKGLERLAMRSDEIGQLARWLRSEAARMLEQEELAPTVPSFAVNTDAT